MRAVVVYESMFGNTQRIAEAIGAGVATRLGVETLEVGGAPPILGDDIALLVVGGPTHAFGMTRDSTREQAAEQAEGPIVSKEAGIREWLSNLEAPSAVCTATFDTCFQKARFMGTAGRAAAKRLRRMGLPVVADPEHFYVSGTPGPLLPGEEERARRWGEEVAETAVATFASRR